MKTEKRYIIMMHYAGAYSHPYRTTYKTREIADEVMKAIARYSGPEVTTVWIESVEI